MAKQRTLEQIESQMVKLKKQKDGLRAELQVLAAERRAIILGTQNAAPNGGGSVTITPDPAILTAKEN